MAKKILVIITSPNDNSPENKVFDEEEITKKVENFNCQIFFLKGRRNDNSYSDNEVIELVHFNSSSDELGILYHDSVGTGYITNDDIKKVFFKKIGSQRSYWDDILDLVNIIKYNPDNLSGKVNYLWDIFSGAPILEQKLELLTLCRTKTGAAQCLDGDNLKDEFKNLHDGGEVCKMIKALAETEKDWPDAGYTNLYKQLHSALNPGLPNQ